VKNGRDSVPRQRARRRRRRTRDAFSVLPVPHLRPYGWSCERFTVREHSPAIQRRTRARSGRGGPVGRGPERERAHVRLDRV
jgi:hypothetical protein